MQVKKAFTLIEIMVSIILLGILYTLAVKNFSKVSKKENFTIENILNYFSKNKIYQNGDFYIYGENCNHSIFIDTNNNFLKTPVISNLSKNFEIYGKNSLGDFEKISFDNIIIDKKNRKVCLKLKINNRKIFDKLLLKSDNKCYTFEPFSQNINIYKSFKKAKENYLLENYLPTNRDKYYEPNKL